MTFLNLGLFLLLQIVASLLFKWGSTETARYWPGFIGGNLFGMSSILMLINLYKAWPAGVVLAVATGGAFMLNQIFMFAVFRENLTIPAWSGVGMIMAGIIMVSLGK